MFGATAGEITISQIKTQHRAVLSKAFAQHFQPPVTQHHPPEIEKLNNLISLHVVHHLCEGLHPDPIPVPDAVAPQHQRNDRGVLDQAIEQVLHPVVRDAIPANIQMYHSLAELQRIH